MGLVAIGATSAPGVQAAPEFHCSIVNCTLTLKPDGTGKTAHHVFIVKQNSSSVAFTCNELTGEATSAEKTTKEVTFKNLKYKVCNCAGAECHIRMNGCDYHIVAEATPPNGSVQVKGCEVSKKIEIEVTTSPPCIITVGEQGPLKGLTFHDAETSGKEVEITSSAIVSGIAVTVDHSNGCTALGFASGAATGEFTTGNLEIKSESHEGAPARVWYL